MITFDMNKHSPIITHVAIQYEGNTYSLPKPNRHHHVIRMIGSIEGPDIQGFLDSNGKFLTREEAVIVALESGQISSDHVIRSGELFSEDIW